MFHLLINLPYQSEFIIASNIENLYNILLLKYGKYVQVCPDGKSCENIIEIYHSKGKYTVKYKDKLNVVSSAVQAISEIIVKNKQYNNSVFALHGAALEKGGKVYLFLASSGTGKTTLTSYLINKAFNYITDDCILIDKNTLMVTPQTTPLQLRNGGLKILNDLGIEFPNIENLEENGIIHRYSFSPANCVDEEKKINTIFFINRTEDCNSLNKISSIEKNKLLLKSSITQYEVNTENLIFISKLSKIDAYQLSFKDLDYVFGVLSNDLQTI